MKVLRTSQIRELLGVNSQTLRVWVDTLPPFCNRESTPRKARNYSAQDALFFLLIKVLVRDMGIQVGSIIPTSQTILEACNFRPLGELRNYHIKLESNKQNAELIAFRNTSQMEIGEPSILIPLETYVDVIHAYLLGEDREPTTLELPFPLHSVSGND